MNILIFDNSNASRAKGLAKALRHSDTNIVVSYQGSFYDADGNAIAGSAAEYALAFLHGTDQAEFEATDLSARCAICYAGDGDADVPRSINSERDAFTDEEVAHIWDVVSNFAAAEWKKAILAYWSAVPEALLSWALLKSYGGANSQPDSALTGRATADWLHIKGGEGAVELRLPDVVALISSKRDDL